MKTTKLLAYAIIIGAGFVLCQATQAEDWKVTGEFGWFGVGKAHQIEKGHFYWVGEFTGTFFNDKGKGSLFHRSGVKCPAYMDADFNTKKSKTAGYCIISDPDGDQAYLVWHAQGDTVSNPGTFEYTGGTGKYQGISGSNTFVGVVYINWPDGTSTGYATWNR